jgi:hypothetical protein
MHNTNNTNNTNNSNNSINLSSIPGFNNIIFNGSKGTDEEDNKFLKLNSVECKTHNNQVYKVIRYDKNFLSIDLVNTFGLCRSVIVNGDNHVVSFAPPKSVSCDEFIKKYPATEGSSIICAEEFVEGTMINAFWDPKIGLSGAWEIATRNTVGATSSFYKNEKTKTFREMFLDAANSINLSLDKLNPVYCYSFVLQHPENRIVVPFKSPKLYLVALYRIDNTDKNNITVHLVDINEVKQTNWYGAKIEFPKSYHFTSYTDLIKNFASMNTSYKILGVVIRNTQTGERTKIRNPVYEQVRSLRGNQPKLQYQYLCLRKENKVRDFLKFYPENKKEFSKFRDQIHLFTETLFSNYVSCYIKKEKPLLDFTEQYRTHMYNIHQVYMNELRDKKLFVMNMTVIKYVNELHPSLLMYSLNYQMRKKNVDTIVSENNV